MKKSKLIYKIFLPTILALTALALIFNALSLSVAYDGQISNIKVGSPFSILFIIFTTLCFIAPIVFAFLSKETSVITRTKAGSIFSIIASTLVIACVLSLMVYDVIVLFKELATALRVFEYSTDMTLSQCFKQYFETWRLFRAVLAPTLIAHLIISIFKKAYIPAALRTFLHCTSILWCIMTPIIIYFHPGTPPILEYFRITYSIMFILFTLFFLFDFKWIYFDSSIRIYSAITAITFSFALIISVGTIIGLIANNALTLHEVALSIFEILTAVALGIYVLSRWLEIYKTVSIVAKKEETK